MTANTWEQQAACRSASPALFFPQPNQTAIDLQKVELAKKFCHSCPVRQACLDYAMRMEGSATSDFRAGIYGGLTPRERSGLYQRRRRQRQAFEQAGTAS
jgi:WhiB family redox-sensing transcriptional regulator